MVGAGAVGSGFTGGRDGTGVGGTGTGTGAGTGRGDGRGPISANAVAGKMATKIEASRALFMSRVNAGCVAKFNRVATKLCNFRVAEP